MLKPGLLSLSGLCFICSPYISIIIFYFYDFYDINKEYKSIYKERNIKGANSGIVSQRSLLWGRLLFLNAPEQVPIGSCSGGEAAIRVWGFCPTYHKVGGVYGMAFGYRFTPCRLGGLFGQ
jgi:hypothetical protein